MHLDLDRTRSGRNNENILHRSSQSGEWTNSLFTVWRTIEDEQAISSYFSLPCVLNVNYIRSHK